MRRARAYQAARKTWKGQAAETEMERARDKAKRAEQQRKADDKRSRAYQARLNTQKGQRELAGAEAARAKARPTARDMENQIKQAGLASADIGKVGMNFMEGVTRAAVGMPTIPYHLARDPKGLVTGVAESYKDYYGPLARGDWGEFASNVQKDPASLFFDTVGIAGAAVGGAARVGSAANAAKATRAARAQIGAQLQEALKGAARPETVLASYLQKYPQHVDEFERSVTKWRRDSRAFGQGDPVPGAAKVFKKHRETNPTKKAESVAEAAFRGFRYPKTRGLGEWNRARKGLDPVQDKHFQELAKEVLEVATNPEVIYPVERKTLRQNLSEAKTRVKEDIAMTRKHDREKESWKKFEPVLRETFDGIRQLVVFARPSAYIGNNWASNLMMNLSHQGFYTPVNVAKSFMMHRLLAPEQRNVLKVLMGQSAARALQGAKDAPGYAKAITTPYLDALSKVADDPFRTAAFLHEARRAGYRTIDDVKTLLDEGMMDMDKFTELIRIGTRAQDEIVKFGRLTPNEQTVWARVVFVYSWMKGAGRYALTYPERHPVQAAAGTAFGQEAYEQSEELTGDLPRRIEGSLPFMGGLANYEQFSPIGTGINVARAVLGTAKYGTGSGEPFDKYVDDDLGGLLHPVIQAAIESREGGKSAVDRLATNIPLTRIADHAFNDGERTGGSWFPSSLQEELVRFALPQWAAPRKPDWEEIRDSAAKEGMTGTAANRAHVRRVQKIRKSGLPRNHPAVKEAIKASFRKRELDTMLFKAKKDKGDDLTKEDRARVAADAVKKLVPGLHTFAKMELDLAERDGGEAAFDHAYRRIRDMLGSTSV